MGLSCHTKFASYLKGWVKWKIGVVEGVSHPYVAYMGISASGANKGKGGMAVWDCPGRGKT